MSKVSLAGNASGTGIFTIASPNSNTDRTLTLPDNTGTLLTNASSFPASQLSDQFSVSSSAPSNSVVVSASGTMTRPYQTAFKAVCTTAYTVAANTEIVFGTTVNNIGSGYNSSTGRFTAPVSGFYHFNVNLRYIGLSYYSWTWRKNGNTQAYCEVAGAGALESINGGYGICFYLNAGDYVSIFNGTQGGLSCDAFCGFSGFLVG